MEWASFLLAALSLFTTWQVGRKKPWAWLVGVGQQLLWITYAIVTEQHGFIMSSLVFAPLNMYNYVKWRREEVKALRCKTTGPCEFSTGGVSLESGAPVVRLCGRPGTARRGIMWCEVYACDECYARWLDRRSEAR